MKEILIEWFNTLGIWAIPLSLLINGVINTIGFIPSVFVTLANVWMWGPFLGGIISWAGELIGSAAGFFLYRKGIQKTDIKAHKKWKWMQTINQSPPIRQTFALIMLRINPLVPSGAVQLLGTFAGVSWTVFLISTAIGKIPSITMEVCFSLGLLNIGESYIKWILFFLTIPILYFIFKKQRNAHNPISS